MMRTAILTASASSLLGGLVLLSGCGASGWGRTDGAGVRVTYDDFIVRREDPTTPAAADAEPEVGSEARNPAAERPVSAEDQRPTDVPSRPVDPHAGGTNARVMPGREVVVDSFVGQINGRPIYANQFFAPIDAHLLSLRDRLQPIQFAAAREEIITRHLHVLLQSELFLAEAESRLTPDQQRGLFAWLTRQREDIISRRGGSEGLATQQLQEYEGLEGGIEQAVADERKRALIQMIIAQEVRPRVRISWRDVERKYNQEYAAINPPGTASIAWIRLLPTQRDEIEESRQRLEAGEDFRSVARAMGMRNDGLLLDGVELGPDGFADAPGLREEYRRQLAGLKAGETAGPFEFTNEAGARQVLWLHVLEINQEPIRTLYDPDVQIILRDVLLRSRFEAEQERFYRDLLVDGTYNEIEKMRTRLFEIGRIRYAR